MDLSLEELLLLLLVVVLMILVILVFVVYPELKSIELFRNLSEAIQK